MHRKSAPLSWRNAKERYKLAGSLEKITGIIESFTIVRNAPNGSEKHAPYILALVKLNDEKITAEIVDSKSVEIGVKVEPCLRKMHADGQDGIIHYGTKFRVAK